MARPKPKETTMQDVFEQMGSRLKLQSVQPNIHGYKPHEKQVLFHSSSARGRLYIGGNRSGKTTGGIVEDIWMSTKKHPYRANILNRPCRGRVVGVDFLQGVQKIILPQFARWLPPSELINGSWEDSYSKAERTLTFANGSFIEFMSYDQDLVKFAGTSRDFIHYDEEPPQDIFTECSARLVDTAGSWWMTMTPVDGMTWIYDNIYLAAQLDTKDLLKVVEVDMRDNPHLLPGEVDMYEASLDSDQKMARIKGKFVQIGGLVYKKFSPEIHVVDHMVPPKEWAWYASLDHGYNNPTAWLWHAVSPDGTVITFDEHYEREQTVDQHSAIVNNRNIVHGRPPDYYVGDPAIVQRNGVTATSIQTEYAQHGIGLLLGDNSVLAGVNRINQYLALNPEGKPNWFITRNCPNLIREIQRLRWKTPASRRTANLNNASDLIHKKDDHACDSARYFFSMLPDLRPVGSGLPEAIHRMMPTAPLGIDAFHAALAPKQDAFRDSPVTTDWYEERFGLDETMGGEW